MRKKPTTSTARMTNLYFADSNPLSLALLVLFCMVSSFLSAQTIEQRNFIKSQTNVAALQQMSTVDGGIARERRITAEQWAIANGIPVSGVNENGQEFRIIDYDSISQAPIYIATTNLNSANTISTNKLWNTGTSGLNLSGSNITITMWDGGRVCDQHPEYINRATPGTYETTIEPISPHATHVAGTQIAEGIVPNAHGMAPSGNMIYYGFSDYSVEIPLEAANGYLLSNHSWGNLAQGWAYMNPDWTWNNYLTYPEYPLFGLYTSSTRFHDIVANNAPYFLMIRSAGNNRGYGQAPNLPHFHNGSGPYYTDYHEIYGGSGGYDCMDMHGTAKNVLTVGAVQDIPNGYTNPADVVLAAFSNTGPTDDGRIKPDIVANGISLYSSFNNGSGTNCNTLNYSSLSGTSMSAPSVTGSCALLQEHYSNTHSGSFMLASTLKALVIETADESGTSNGPDYHHGWGLMNTKKAAEIISKDQTDPSIIQELTLSNGQTIDIPISITSTNICYISSTIVWNDPAGAALPISLDPTTPNLVNDLDLRIIDPLTNINFPWTLDPANPASAAIQTADNFRDNVEQVRIYNAAPGNYIVRITHKGTLTNPQDFSVIINSVPELDLYTKDILDDIGIEPNPAGGPMWISDDIWVRNTNDGFINQTHQNPIFASNPNYVYVRVRNNGCNPSLGTEELKLHWAKAASALSWPDYWDISFGVTCNGGPPMGDIIALQTIPVIPPGGETILEFQWNVPDPDDYNGCNLEPAHFCLLSRILATNDPMTFPEVASVYDNAKNNNNIAWKNITIVHMLLASGNEECPHDQVVGGTIAIGNPFHDRDDNYKLEFKLDEKNRGIPLHKQAEIKITLDDLSWEKWMQGGHQGENIRIKREDCHQLVITGNPATLENLHYEPMKRSTINLSFNFLTDKVDAISEFDYHVIQTRTEDDKIIGGELYRIKKPTRYLFGADAGSDRTISEGASTTLNASNIGESAYYNWYDTDGNLIYSGNNFTVSPEITSKYKLQVIAHSDGFSSYDSITVTVKDCEIQSITPNPSSTQITIQYKAQNVTSGYLVITHASGSPNDNYILNLNQNTKVINVANYASGNYNLILVCDGEVKDQKVLSIVH